MHTDHQNLTYKKFTSDRVMRWRLFIEEYSPDLRYIKGKDNVVADALSRLEKLDQPFDDSKEIFYSLMHSFVTENEPYDVHPLSYSKLDNAQCRHASIKKILTQSNCNYYIKDLHGGGKARSLVCYNEKIVVPNQLQKHVIDWYHTVLCHPGINRTKETIGQHLYWPKMRDQITRYVQACPTCQKNKRKVKK